MTNLITRRQALEILGAPRDWPVKTLLAHVPALKPPTQVGYMLLFDRADVEAASRTDWANEHAGKVYAKQLAQAARARKARAERYTIALKGDPTAKSTHSEVLALREAVDKSFIAIMEELSRIKTQLVALEGAPK